MESCIKVITTPNIIGKAFRDQNAIMNIRFFEALNFKDPEPDLNNEAWSKKYGDDEYVYRVIIRHAETRKYLRENYVYHSLKGVERALKRLINTSK